MEGYGTGSVARCRLRPKLAHSGPGKLCGQWTMPGPGAFFYRSAGARGLAMTGQAGRRRWGKSSQAWIRHDVAKRLSLLRRVVGGGG